LPAHLPKRPEIFEGRVAIVGFLTEKWAEQLDDRLVTELRVVHENRIAVRFQYGYRNAAKLDIR
jgi:nuclear transport factor 2 (NTF2) superfamily protein